MDKNKRTDAKNEGIVKIDINKTSSEEVNPESIEHMLNALLKKIHETFKEINENYITNLSKIGELLLSTINKDYQDERKEIDTLLRHGWTIPYIGFLHKIDENNDILHMNSTQVDHKILEFYTENNSRILEDTIRYILDSINPSYKVIIEDSFLLYKENRFSTAIPSLMIVIENEVYRSIGLKNHKKIPHQVKASLDFHDIRKQIKPNNLAAYSFSKYISDQLFTHTDFNKDEKMLNRHKVLHGRDNPDNWNEIDFIRLIHTLLTLFLLDLDTKQKKS